jgi:serine protease Do
MSDTPRNSILQRSRRALIGACAALALVGGGLAAPSIVQSFAPPAQAQLVAGAQRPVGFADVVERVKPAVVAVQVRRDGGGRFADGPRGFRGDQVPGRELSPNDPLWRFLPPEARERFQQGRPGGATPGTSQGSGFFISADGFVVTNNHVIDGASAISIVTDDGERFEARLVGADARTDIAVLKVDANRQFPTVGFARSQPRIGDWVVAIGNPFGLGGTVTAGIVSARGRNIGNGPYDDYVQIDAPVNRGNSGGPTFNVEGEVIGINTAIFSPSGGSVGIGFAIPASLAEDVVAQLRQGGSVSRGFLGVNIQNVTGDIAQSLGLREASGVLVAEVQPNTPAARGGLRPGDVILALNGQPIRESRDLSRRVAQIAPGATARLDIVREGARQVVAVELGRLSDPRQAAVVPGPSGREGPVDTSALETLGLRLGPSPQGAEGVSVTQVDPRGIAARRGLRTGDVILDLGGRSVETPEDVAARITAARAEGRPTILARVRSGGQIRFVTLPISDRG